MNIELKESFEVIELGTHYELPTFKVVDGKGIELTGNTLPLKFVRGSKVNNKEVECKEGLVHETLLSAMITDLKFKNSLVPCVEGEMTIIKLTEALGWLRQRQIDRERRSVIGTYQK